MALQIFLEPKSDTITSHHYCLLATRFVDWNIILRAREAATDGDDAHCWLREAIISSAVGPGLLQPRYCTPSPSTFNQQLHSHCSASSLCQATQWKHDYFPIRRHFSTACDHNMCVKSGNETGFPLTYKTEEHGGHQSGLLAISVRHAQLPQKRNKCRVLCFRDWTRWRPLVISR